jgi:hypothetical protein
MVMSPVTADALLLAACQYPRSCAAQDRLQARASVAQIWEMMRIFTL